MVKKQTWQDAKKKKEKEEAELQKLYDQLEDLQAKIKKKEQSHREAYAEYLIQLHNSGEKTDAEVERFFLSPHPHLPSGGDH
ncbi:TPA: hypothetical protein ACPXF4_001909 [Streptococcus suis]